MNIIEYIYSKIYDDNDTSDEQTNEEHITSSDVIQSSFEKDFALNYDTKHRMEN